MKYSILRDISRFSSFAKCAKDGAPTVLLMLAGSKAGPPAGSGTAGVAPNGKRSSGSMAFSGLLSPWAYRVEVFYLRCAIPQPGSAAISIPRKPV